MSTAAPHGLYTPEEILALLPALYRVRDAEGDGALRELVEVICEQVNVVAEGIESLYDDQFIETCADWAAPYIGDLIGYRPLHGVVPRVASPRAEVANTIRYRRRKGTASMLEQLARDVTGWPAQVVEYFELLATSQYMKHIRSHAPATPDVRDALRLEMGGAANAGANETWAHTAEMRHIDTGGGRFNIPNIGIFLWRVQAQQLTRVPLVDADGAGIRYRFDPLGADSQLFGDPRPETDVTHLAEPLDVPLPLTVRWVAANREHYVGQGRSILVEEDSGAGPSAPTVEICDLSDDPATPGAWSNEPPAGGPVVVDPHLGRVAFPSAPAASAERMATFHRGSALCVGGGGYDRADDIEPVDHVVPVTGGGPLAAALTSVAAGGAAEIGDCGRYQLPPTITTAAPTGDDPATTLRATNRMWPHLSRNGQVKLDITPEGTLVLDGLLLAGAPLVIEEHPDTDARRLVLRHCTLVPGLTRTPDGAPGTIGRASLLVLHPFAEVEIDHCITGPVVAVEGAEVSITDSVVDASGPGEVAYCGRAPATGGALRTVSSAADRDTGDGAEPGGRLITEATTVVGRVHAERVDISNSLVLAEATLPTDAWPAPLWAERRQVGCIRHSFLPTPVRAPRRFACVPGPGGEGAELAPQHTSLRYGDPGYAQLRASTPRAIRTGTDDESEMGVTRSLYEPQREANLRIRLEEYLRFGREAGFRHAT